LIAMLVVTGCDGRKVKKPNFLFMHDESTDGRTYFHDSIVPIPNIRKLQERGVFFQNHYVNVPICCPSRASMWAGRQPHNIPHIHNDIQVDGAWNNYEGVGTNDTDPGVNTDQLIYDHLDAAGYDVQLTGKTDWSSGGHSLTTMVDSWTIYARFPYSQPEQGGWHIWGDCGGNLSVLPGNESAHEPDWKIVHANVAWLQDRVNNASAKEVPFFLYQGLNIVHPDYDTNQEYLDRIPQSKIVIPEWVPLEQLHPCDFQTTMKKGCAHYSYQNTPKHKRQIIAGYYAMIAEYDDMVGTYVQGLEESGYTDDTIVVLSSDHGDMQMQHQQFYKMVAYEASTHVPLVIAAGKNFPMYKYRGNVQHLTSAVDVFPTFLDLAGVKVPDTLDGHSLVKFLETGEDTSHPTNIISQFHGENLVMSWYMVREGEIKATFWGTGTEHPAQMFNLTSDPNENINLALNAKNKKLLDHMEKLLLAQADYPKISMDVAKHNIDMAKWWIEDQPKWKCILNGTCVDAGKRQQGVLNADWGTLWQLGPASYFKAWDQWINSPPTITKCLSTLTHDWPPVAN